MRKSIFNHAKINGRFKLADKQMIRLLSGLQFTQYFQRWEDSLEYFKICFEKTRIVRLSNLDPSQGIFSRYKLTKKWMELAIYL